MWDDHAEDGFGGADEFDPLGFDGAERDFLDVLQECSRVACVELNLSAPADELGFDAGGSRETCDGDAGGLIWPGGPCELTELVLFGGLPVFGDGPAEGNGW